jgi:hypothetical protein
MLYFSVVLAAFFVGFIIGFAYLNSKIDSIEVDIKNLKDGDILKRKSIVLHGCSFETKSGAITVKDTVSKILEHLKLDVDIVESKPQGIKLIPIAKRK